MPRAEGPSVQVTAVFGVPVTVAVNGWLWERVSVTLPGASTTVAVTL